MGRELEVQLKFKAEKELDERLKALAARRGETKAEVCRRLLRQAVAQEMAEEGLDPVLVAVRQAVKEVMKPIEERLAKINAKSAIASATSMYSNLEVLASLNRDVRNIYEVARKKAVAFIKTPNDELTSE